MEEGEVVNERFELIKSTTTSNDMRMFRILPRLLSFLSVIFVMGVCTIMLLVTNCWFMISYSA